MKPEFVLHNVDLQGDEGETFARGVSIEVFEGDPIFEAVDEWRRKYRYSQRSSWARFRLRLITAIGIAAVFFAAGLGVGAWAL